MAMRPFQQQRDYNEMLCVTVVSCNDAKWDTNSVSRH